MKIKRLTAAAVATSVVLAVFAYLDRYQYFKINNSNGYTLLVRTNRWTDETDVFGSRGWQEVQTPTDWKYEHGYFQRRHSFDPTKPYGTAQP